MNGILQEQYDDESGNLCMSRHWSQPSKPQKATSLFREAICYEGSLFLPTCQNFSDWNNAVAYGLLKHPKATNLVVLSESQLGSRRSSIAALVSRVG